MMQVLSAIFVFLVTSADAWTINPKQTRRLPSLRMTSAENGRVAEGSVVTIDCRLKPEGDFVPDPVIDGVILHDEDEPVRLAFVLGAGNYLPGLHDLVADLQVGESKEGVSLDAGWGSRNPDLVATASFESAGIANKSDIKPGVQLSLSNGMQCVVTEVSEDTFTIDANPPLAGASYEASVKLLNVEEGIEAAEYSDQLESSSRYQVATFALGCFWGGELEYMREPGVVGTSVGYTQGEKTNPTYNEVCSGTTGHTEAISVIFDPDVVSYERLVQLAMDRLGENKFLLNQVGNDKGTQYRHGVYYHTPEQKEIAKRVVGKYGDDCVTECLPAKKWWPGEDYHQQYLLKGGQSARKQDTSVIRCYG